MELLSDFLIIVVIASAIIGGFWLFMRRPKRAEKSKEKFDVPAPRPNAELGHPQPDVEGSYPVLKGKNPIARKLKVRQIKGVSKDAGAAIEAQTELMKKQGEQVKAYQRTTNELADLQSEGELKPLQHEHRASDLEADIAENKLRQVAAKKKAEALERPAIAPPTPKREKLDPEQRANAIKDRFDKKEASIKAHSHPPDIEERLIEKAREEYERELNRLYE